MFPKVSLIMLISLEGLPTLLSIVTLVIPLCIILMPGCIMLLLCSFMHLLHACGNLEDGSPMILIFANLDDPLCGLFKKGKRSRSPFGVLYQMLVLLGLDQIVIRVRGCAKDLHEFLIEPCSGSL